VHAASAQPPAFYLSGQVRDAHGPLESAYVRVLPKGQVTLSEETGYYRLELPSADSVQIECSCMGYATVTKMWRGEQRLDFSLHEQSAEIGEVVVRANIHALDVRVRTGNVEQVDLPKVREKPMPSLVLALQGAIPGLQITNRGLSGERPEVRLRGTSSLRTGDVANEPLYVLDGVPVSTGTIQGLNPNDFAQVDVLKDASATSIYGSRAANGVIYITTKKGSQAQKGTVTARFSYGWSNLVDRSYFDNVMTSKELIDFYQEFRDVFYPYTPKQIDSMHARNDNKNYKWVDYYFRKNAPMHQGDISFASPRGKTTYYVSGGYLYQDGLKMNSKYQKYNLRGNVDSKVLPWLRMGMNNAVYYDITNTYPFLNTKEGVNFDNFPQIYLPWLTPYDSTGKIGEYMPDMDGPTNEHIMKYWKMGTGTASILTNAYLQFEPIKGLTYKVQAGLEAYYSEDESTQSPEYYWNVKHDRGGSMRKTTDRRAKPIITNTIEYKFTLFNDHHFIPLLGHEYIYSYWDEYKASAYDIKDARLMLMQNGDT